MALPVPPDYTSSIPNNPFYYPQEYYVVGPYNPFIVGAGLSVDSAGTLTSVGSGGGVNSLIAGTGITVDSPAGNVTISNTGVTSLTAGTGISLTSTTGDIAISVTGLTNGTVTRVNTGAGLTGGPITGLGTICLAPSGVGPTATYTNPTITVDTYGRILNASNNTVLTGISVTPPLTISGTTAPTLGVNQGTTTALGVVQLSSSLTDPGSLYAATTGAVKCAYDIATQAIPKSCVTAKGTLITGTNPSTPVALPVGSNGQVLVSDSTCATGLKWAPGSSVVGNPNFGSFLSTQTQTISVPGTPQPVTLNTVVDSNNFRVESGSRIVASVPGTYNLQFSLQLFANPGGGGAVEIWLNKGVSQVPNSNTRFFIKNTNEAEFAALNFVETLGAEEYLELYWSTADNDNFLYTESGPTALGGPSIPSAIITIVPVGA